MLAQMVLVGTNGGIYFFEDNRSILWTEMVVTMLVTVFGLAVFGVQLRRLGERRSSDRLRRARR